jgi:predicted SnoaL-like aldol condensation-catalyzing enzyme
MKKTATKKSVRTAVGVAVATTGVALGGVVWAGTAQAQTATPRAAGQQAQFLFRGGEAARVAANKRVIEKFTADVLNGHNGDHALRYFNSDMTWHGGTIGTVPGAQNVAGLFTQVVTSIPDLHADVKDIMGAGDEVTVRLVVTGTLRGPLLGLQATGQHLQWDAVDEYRLQNGKISEDWAGDDFTAILNETGTFKAPWIQ